MHSLHSLFIICVSTLCLSWFLRHGSVQGALCGYPGKPAFGTILEPITSRSVYVEGETVNYACNPGYFMKRKPFRRCLPSGIWSGEIPICDTTLSKLGIASSHSALALYPPELAIDGNPRSCFYSNRHKPRWWRVDLTTTLRVLSVAITVPFASSEHFFTVYVIDANKTITNYNRCASFQGIFVTQSKILVCGSEGIEGRILHIEDNSKHFEYFGLCEVKIFVEKESYECGEPEQPANSFPIESHKGTEVEYRCQRGYNLEGPFSRVCQNNGQWSGEQPVCREVTCREPDSIKNGNFKINGPSGARPVQSSETTYSCSPGYYLVGNSTIICLSNGLWHDATPSCDPVDCGLPSDIARSKGGRFLLLNGTTTFESVAQLVCDNGNPPIGTNGLLYCRENGFWSQLSATCLYQITAALESHINPLSIRENDAKLLTVLGSILSAVFLSIFILILFLFKKKILLFKFSSEPETDNVSPKACQELSDGEGGTGHGNLNIRRDGHSSRLSTSSNNCSLVLNDFNCSLPLRRVARTLSHVASHSGLDNVYEEISIDGAIAERFMHIDACKKVNSPNSNPSNSSSATATDPQVAADQRNRTDSVSSNENGTVVALYAKVDFSQKNKNRLCPGSGQWRPSGRLGRKEIEVEIEKRAGSREKSANMKEPDDEDGQEEEEVIYANTSEDEDGPKATKRSGKTTHYAVIDNVAYADHPSLKQPAQYEFLVD